MSESKGNFEFEWITDWETIYSDHFKEQWLEWVESAQNSHVFFHPALSMAWVETYRPIRNLSPLFCVARKSNTIIFFPLVLWRQNWKNAFRKLIVPVGYSDFDYHDPIIIGKCNSEILLDFYSDFFKLLKSRMKFDAMILDGLHVSLPPSIIEENSTEPCPFIKLENFNNIEDYKQRLPYKLIKDLERRIRRASDIGKIEFKVFKKDESDLAILELPKMLALHKERWPDAYKAPNFHSNLITSGLRQGVLHFSKMSIGDNPVSWRIGFYDKERFYSYMPTFDPLFLKFSPGKIHLLFCIEEALRLNLKIYDQLRGAELYKSEWTQEFEEISNYQYACSRFTSHLKSLVLDLKNQVKN